MSKACYDHYAGFFRNVCHEHEKTPERRVKRLLYAYRVALTGIHLLRTGAVVADVSTLAPRYGFDEALELVEIKRQGAEATCISADEDALHRAAWPRLARALDEARAESPLPAAAENTAECSAWLVQTRRRELNESHQPWPPKALRSREEEGRGNT